MFFLDLISNPLLLLSSVHFTLFQLLNCPSLNPQVLLSLFPVILLPIPRQRQGSEQVAVWYLLLGFKPQHPHQLCHRGCRKTAVLNLPAHILCADFSRQMIGFISKSLNPWSAVPSFPSLFCCLLGYTNNRFPGQ